MPKMKPDRDDSRGGLGGDDPQTPEIGREAGNQRQEGASVLDDGGMGDGELGQGSQRTPNGSSRDSEKLGS